MGLWAPTMEQIAGIARWFCGALTAYSTFGYKTVRLAERGSVRYGFANTGVSLTAGLAAAWLGLLAASSLWG